MSGWGFVKQSKAAVLLVLAFTRIGLGNLENESDMFTRWLAELQLQLGDATVGVAGGTAHAMNITCSNISLSSIASSADAASTLALRLRGIALRCDGQWAYERQSFPKVDSSGSLEVEVSSGSLSLHVGLVGHNPLAERFVVPQPGGCSASISIDKIRLHGSALGTFIDVVTRVLSPVIRSHVEREACTQLSSLIQDNMTSLLQEVNQPLRQLIASASPPLPKGYMPGSVALQSNPLLAAMRILASGPLAPSLLNDLMGDFLLQAKTNALSVPLNVCMHTQAGNTANVELRLHNSATLYGLNSLTNLHGPHVINANLLSIEGELDSLELDIPAEVHVMPLSGSVQGDELVERCVVKLKFSSTAVRLYPFLAVNGTALKEFKADELSQRQCRADVVQHLNISGADANVSVDSASILPLNSRNYTLEGEIDETITKAGQLLLSNYEDVIERVARHAIQSQFSLDHMTAFVHNWLERKASGKCKTSVQRIFSRYEPASDIILGIALVTFIASIGLSSVHAVYWILNRSQSNATGRHDSQYSWQNSVTLPLLVTRTGPEKLPKRLGASLSSFLELSVYLVCITNALLFLSSNLSIAASVRLRVTYKPSSKGEAASEIDAPSLFDFSLPSTVAEMWLAGVYPLSIIILIFSGLWPYIKLIAISICLCLPPSLLPKARRRALLSITDVLGKWSFIDGFVLALFIVAFHMRFAQKSHDGEEFQSVIFVQPHLGCFTFIFAVILSLVTNHLVRWLDLWQQEVEKQHRLSSYELQDNEDPQLLSDSRNNLPCQFRGNYQVFQYSQLGLERRKMFHKVCSRLLLALQTHKIRSLRESTCRKHHLPFFSWSMLQILSLCLLGSALASLVLGVWFPSFSFTYGGVLGYLLDGEQNRRFSIARLVSELPSSAEDSSPLGLHLVQVTVVLFAVVAAILHVSLLSAVWFIPRSAKWTTMAKRLIEMAEAWSAPDVFFVSIVACVLQIEQFSAFILGSKCDGIDVALAHGLSKWFGGETQCYTLRTQLIHGAWPLVFASCTWLVASKVSMHFINSEHLLDTDGVYTKEELTSQQDDNFAENSRI